MINLHLTRGDNYEGIYLQLPATPAAIGEAFSWLDEISPEPETTKIVGAVSPIVNLGQYIKNANVNEIGVLDKLNALAERIQMMTRDGKTIFSGALDVEAVSGLEDVLDIACNLDRYTFIPGVTNNKELGGYLVESGYKDFPEHVHPYLDYAGIGAEYYAERGGAYTMDGYVLRREACHVQMEQMEQKEPVIRLWLHTMKGAGMILNLPATEEQLDAAKRALNVEEFSAAQISRAEMHHYVAGNLPMDAICVEDANELAAVIEEMLEADDESLSKFLAVLAVERPDTFPAAFRLAMEQDDYDIVPDDPWAYGEYTLRRVCQDQEVLDTIDGFMDYKALGEFQMKEDGVRETEFGAIVRLSAPFPQQEQRQQML